MLWPTDSVLLQIQDPEGEQNTSMNIMNTREMRSIVASEAYTVDVTLSQRMELEEHMYNINI